MAMKNYFAVALASLAISGPVLADELKPLSAVQHPDVARAENAIQSLSPEKRQEAEYLLDLTREAINDRADGNPEIYYNKVVTLLMNKGASMQTAERKATR